MKKENQWGERGWAGPGGLSLLLLLLLLFMFLALRLGSVSMTNGEFFSALFSSQGEEKQRLILYTLRLPRVLGAVLAGMGLSTAGVLLQGITGNELAGPNIIGVNAGAGFAVIILLLAAPGSVFFTPIAAFAGAFLTTILILTLAERSGKSKATMILAGIAITTLLNAGISFCTLLDPEVLASYHYFSVGGLEGITLEQLLLPGSLIFLAALATGLLGNSINALCLGDGVAASLGIPVKKLRGTCMLLASVAAASVVSFAGLLGFIGLVVPHMGRRLVGNSIGKLLPVSLLLGGSLTVAADLLGRVLFAPSQIPVGIVMAFIGAPFFFWLLFRRKRYDEFS